MMIHPNKGRQKAVKRLNLRLIIRIICLLILNLYNPPISHAQSQATAYLNTGSLIRPEIINYSSTQYQAESQNWSVIQGADSLLFFANNQGLLSYDGASWRRYPLPENQILRTVASDENGRIYGGGFGVFGYYEKKDYNGYQFHNLSALVKDSLFGQEEIWKIIAASNFVLFQSFSRIHLLHNGTVKTIVAPGTILYTYPIRDHFYVQVLGKGLFRISDAETLEPVSNQSILSQQRITMMLPFGTREILLGTEKDGLMLFDPMTGSLNPFATSVDELLKTAEINNGLKLGDDLYAIGTIGQGVLFINAKGRAMALVNKKSGLLNNTILGLCQDKTGNLWLAMDKGIAQLVLKSNVAYFKDLDGRIGTVYAVAIYNHKIYIGSNHGLYEAPYTDMAHFSLADLKQTAPVTGQVWDLKVIDGILFCGNNTGTYTIQVNKIQKISTLTGGWDLQPQINRQTGQVERLLQGTYNGIAVYQKVAGQWQFSHLLKGTQNMAISKIALDMHGQIWAMHAYKGIYVLTPDSSFRYLIKSRLLPLKNLGPTTLRWCMFAYQNEIRLAGTAGIFSWYPDQRILRPDTSLASYFSPYQHPAAIFQDKAMFTSTAAVPKSKKEAYWVLDQQGQLHYKSKGGEWSHFALNKHLFNLVRGFESILAIEGDNQGQSLLTGEDGFVLLHKTERTLPINLSGPSFRQINLISEGQRQLLPSKYFTPEGSLRLPYRKNNLLISYSLPYYQEPVSYSYRLKGSAEQSWSPMSTAGEKELSNLPAGHYQFQVRSSLSEKVSTLNITVLNPWYYSIAARCIYLFLLFIIAALLWRWHKHRLKVQRQAMTYKMREALQLQREKNANQLLMLEQQKLSEEVLHKSEDLAKLAMELIKKKKALKRFKEELDHMKTQKDQNSLEVESRIQKLSKSLSKYIQDEENDWQLFDNGFSKVHEVFFEKLVQAYPELTSQDLRLAAYLKMNLASKEIAPLLNISIRGVEIKRYRLRKKLQLGPHDNLSDFMLRF